jgi:hypothetical protein
MMIPLLFEGSIISLTWRLSLLPSCLDLLRFQSISLLLLRLEDHIHLTVLILSILSFDHHT